jgi:hypothetical protein
MAEPTNSVPGAAEQQPTPTLSLTQSAASFSKFIRPTPLSRESDPPPLRRAASSAGQQFVLANAHRIRTQSPTTEKALRPPMAPKFPHSHRPEAEDGGLIDAAAPTHSSPPPTQQQEPGGGNPSEATPAGAQAEESPEEKMTPSTSSDGGASESPTDSTLLQRSNSLQIPTKPQPDPLRRSNTQGNLQGRPPPPAPVSQRRNRSSDAGGRVREQRPSTPPSSTSGTQPIPVQAEQPKEESACNDQGKDTGATTVSPSPTEEPTHPPVSGNPNPEEQTPQTEQAASSPGPSPAGEFHETVTAKEASEEPSANSNDLIDNHETDSAEAAQHPSHHAPREDVITTTPREEAREVHGSPSLKDDEPASESEAKAKAAEGASDNVPSGAASQEPKDAVDEQVQLQQRVVQLENDLTRWTAFFAAMDGFTKRIVDMKVEQTAASSTSAPLETRQAGREEEGSTEESTSPELSNDQLQQALFPALDATVQPIRSKTQTLQRESSSWRKFVDEFKAKEKEIRALKEESSTTNRYLGMRRAALRQTEATLALIVERLDEETNTTRQFLFRTGKIVDAIQKVVTQQLEREFVKDGDAVEQIARVDPYATMGRMIRIDADREGEIEEAQCIAFQADDRLSHVLKSEILPTAADVKATESDADARQQIRLNRLKEEWAAERVTLVTLLRQEVHISNELRHHCKRMPLPAGPTTEGNNARSVSPEQHSPNRSAKAAEPSQVSVSSGYDGSQLEIQALLRLKADLDDEEGALLAAKRHLKDSRSYWESSRAEYIKQRDALEVETKRLFQARMELQRKRDANRRQLDTLTLDAQLESINSSCRRSPRRQRSQRTSSPNNQTPRTQSMNKGTTSGIQAFASATFGETTDSVDGDGDEDNDFARATGPGRRSSSQRVSTPKKVVVDPPETTPRPASPSRVILSYVSQQRLLTPTRSASFRMEEISRERVAREESKDKKQQRKPKAVSSSDKRWESPKLSASFRL